MRQEWKKVFATTMSVVAAAALLSGAVPAVHAEAAGQGVVVRDEDPNIPVFGQHIVPRASSTVESAGMIVSLHGVYRTPNATVVSYSATGAQPDGERTVHKLSDLWAIPRLFRANSDAAVVIDPASGKAYLGLPSENGNDCLCSHSLKALTMFKEPSDAVILATGIAPLPADVRDVDVFVSGTLFHSVPVKDGLPQPQRNNPDPAYLGEGWPTLDEDEMKRSAEKYKGKLVRVVTFPSEDDSGIAQLPTGGEDRLSVPADVLFEFDKASLTPAATKTIAAVAEQIKAKGIASGEIRVVGHTDSDGTHERNVELSKQRADVVAAELKKQIPSGITLVTEGKAESQPIASNDTKEGKAKNRRVELTLPKGR